MAQQHHHQQRQQLHPLATQHPLAPLQPNTLTSHNPLVAQQPPNSLASAPSNHSPSQTGPLSISGHLHSPSLTLSSDVGLPITSDSTALHQQTSTSTNNSPRQILMGTAALKGDPVNNQVLQHPSPGFSPAGSHLSPSLSPLNDSDLTVDNNIETLSHKDSNKNQNNNFQHKANNGSKASNKRKTNSGRDLNSAGNGNKNSPVHNPSPIKAGHQTNGQKNKNGGNNSNKTLNKSGGIIATDEDGKPCQSYIGLIAQAILSTPERKMILSDIYSYILEHYPYFNERTGWRNSIRHNLSLNDCFVKGPRAANGKGHLWEIHPANIKDFTKGK